MSHRIDLATAPIKSGIIGTPATGSWSTSPAATMSGTYIGSGNKTLTFEVEVAGLIGTASDIQVSWSDGMGNGWTLYLGTNNGYVAGTAVYVTDGVYVAFAAGTFVLAATLTVGLSARNVLPTDAVVISGIPEPLGIGLVSVSHANLDPIQETYSGRLRGVRRAISRRPSLMLDYMTRTELEKLLSAESERHLFMVGENYDLDTLLLWRSWLSVVGPMPVFTRTGTGTYQDRRTGLFRTVGTNIMRFEDGQVGKALLFDAGGTTNLMRNFHPKSGTLGWAQGTATATCTFDTSVRGVLDPSDAGWTSTFLAGVMRVDATAGSTIESTDTTVAAFTAGNTLTGQVWVRGRGILSLSIRAGNGSASTVRGTSANLTLDAQTWQRLSVTAATSTGGGGDTVADMLINIVEECVFYVSGSQLEEGFVPTALIQTDGSAASRGAEVLKFGTQIPPDEGSFAFSIYWPGDAGTSFYRLFECVSGGSLWATRYSAVNSNIEFHTGAASALTASKDLAAGTWYRLAFVWKRLTASNLSRAIYIDGALSSSDDTGVANWDSAYTSSFDLGRLTGNTLHGVRIEELRVDHRAWSASEALDDYQRMTTNEWVSQTMDHGGRKYRIASFDYSWRDMVHRGDIVAMVGLEEADRDEDSTSVEEAADTSLAHQSAESVPV